MSNCAIVGINWGDEGKGRMVDLIAREYDIVCRYQGGNNAGHTIVNEYGKFALHLIPSGICLPGVVNVLGNGVVIDLESLWGEISELQKAGVPIISCMGAGNKLDPSRFRVADIYKTQGCPLARVMRTALRKRGVKKLKVVYSDEIPTRPIEDMSISCRSHCICPPGAKHTCTERRDIPGSTAFVPSVAGLIIAGEVVKDLSRA